MKENPDYRLKYLAYLLEIISAGTQIEAADNLNISQPALSQAIDSLEKSWGVQIFEKKGHTLILTQAGEAVAEYSKKIFQKTQELRAILDAFDEGATGSLLVGMTDSANLYILPDALTKFRSKFADVELHLLINSSEPLWEMLEDFELDMAFVIYNPELDLEFEVEEITTQDLYLYAPKSLDSKVSPWALYPPNSQTRALIDRGVSAKRLRPNVVMETGNPQILNQMVKLGFACSVLPETEADKELANLKCQKITSRKLVALTRKGSPKDTRIENLIALARA